MISIDLIKERISLLQTEQSRLQQDHNELIQEHQRRTEQVRVMAQANADRMQQISGAILTLRSFLNGEEKPKDEK